MGAKGSTKNKHQPESTENGKGRATFSNTSESNSTTAHNNLIIWLDRSVDERQRDYRNALSKLRDVIDDVVTFTDTSSCMAFLKNNTNDRNIFFICSGAFGHQLLPEIHDMSQIDSIYIYCFNKAQHETWARDWSKIQGVFTSIEPVCDQIKTVTRDCDRNEISMSFVPESATAAMKTFDSQNLNQLEPTFMYSVLFKEIIMEIDEDTDKSIDRLVKYFQKKSISQAQLQNFHDQYYQRSPIWWYTTDTFLHKELNRALRSLDVEGMIKMGFYIRNLHKELQSVHEKQSDTFKEQFTVYRGQELNQVDFQHLVGAKGGLVSFNCFLSTSKKQKKAMEFAIRAASKSRKNTGIFFMMTIDPTKISSLATPYAYIEPYTAIQGEYEVLFSMHTIFRIDHIQQMTNQKRVWEVQLTITDSNDSQLIDLARFIRNETQDSVGWFRMGKLMLKLGHFNQAEEFYNELLANATSDREKAHIYHQLGWLKDEQSKYEEAILFYDKSLAMKRRFLPEDHITLAPIYSNIGQVYSNIHRFTEALDMFEKALAIYEKTLPANHPDLAASYNNIGGVYGKMKTHGKALTFYEKALVIYEKNLLPNHPNLATSHNNVGMAYADTGDFRKALEHLDKALSIWQKSLPPTHICITTAMNNIHHVKKKMK